LLQRSKYSCRDLKNILWAKEEERKKERKKERREIYFRSGSFYWIFDTSKYSEVFIAVAR
jgi:hypothetical protein